MDFSDPSSLSTLSSHFLAALSPSAAPRRHAESSLSSASASPNFSIAVLRLAADPSLPADDTVRRSAAVAFKNHLRLHYPPTSDSPLPDAEKTQIKSYILPLMLSSSPAVRSQLGESLSIISSHDFPSLWPTLLPELVSSLHTAANNNNFSAANGLLSAAASVFSKFRHAFDTPAIRLDLKYCLDNFAAPLLTFFKQMSQVVDASVGNVDALRPLFEFQRLCCEIFYSLNCIELPEFFEDHIGEWMDEFHKYLVTKYPAAVEGDGTVDALRAAICENLQLYMEKNEEEFKDHLPRFAMAVWELLMSPAAGSPVRDQLTITAIKFLTTVSVSVHHALFQTDAVLQQICYSIVFPNVRMSEEDEERFEMDAVEYIRRDMEGSDVDTRRRTACELLKGIASNYKEQVLRLVTTQIGTMLAAYAANPGENWKEKDCAIYLVLSLSNKTGGSIVDVMGFFTSVIVPELQAQDVNAASVLKADALKYVTVYREQIPKDVVVSLLPALARFLVAESNVVHSYAANCIEKLLLVKDRVQGPNGAMLSQPRYVASDIDPCLQSLATNLFQALQLAESQENPYVMKCIMRILGIANVGGDVATVCITRLALLLDEVRKNPKNPLFNHYLFEAIAALIGRSLEMNPSLIGVFETHLFPVLQNILVEDVSEFWPYTFQIFAQLVDMSRPPLSGNYMELFQVLLQPETWKKPANAPALVRLLQAYLQKVPNELNDQGKLSQVLGIFNKLISGNSTEDLGFYVLNTVVENLRYDIIAPLIGHIWIALFQRLQNRRTVKFVNSLVIFMSLVLVKHGTNILVDSINDIPPKGTLFGNILQQFWIPNLRLIYGTLERKLGAVASTRLLCESPLVLDPLASELWGKMLDSIISLLTRQDNDGAELETDSTEVPDNVGYTASFARLQNASRRQDDPLEHIRDPKDFLISSLSTLSAANPGRYPAIIANFVDPANRASLLQFCGAYNRTIV